MPAMRPVRRLHRLRLIDHLRTGHGGQIGTPTRQHRASPTTHANNGSRRRRVAANPAPAAAITPAPVGSGTVAMVTRNARNIESFSLLTGSVASPTAAGMRLAG